MASSAAATTSAPFRQSLFARIVALIEAIDGDHFAAPEVRIQHLEQRVAQLEAAAARREG